MPDKEPVKLTKALQAKWNKRLAQEGLSMTAGKPGTRHVKLVPFDESKHSPVHRPCCGPDCGG